MSKAIASVVFGISLALGASVAFAAEPSATLTDTDGKILVNQGEEFVPAPEGVRLKAGDRIMAQKGADATVTFDDECKLEIEENTIVTLPEKSPCAGGVPLVQELNPAGGSAIGSTGGTTGTGNGGVWAMVGIVAAIDLWWLSEDDDEIVSP